MPPAERHLTHCCGAANWVEAMLKERPFTNDQEVHQYADDFWSAATKADILEAFSHHPRIGGKLSESRGSTQGEGLVRIRTIPNGDGRRSDQATPRRRKSFLL